jgi:hypothetical protein
MRGADPAEAVPQIEIDRPAVFGVDLQPGAFGPGPAAAIRGALQQRGASSVCLVS